jgi:hypothetical protein
LIKKKKKPATPTLFSQYMILGFIILCKGIKMTFFFTIWQDDEHGEAGFDEGTTARQYG